MSEALITEESAKLINEVRQYLENDVTAIEIQTPEQKIAVIALGNELQKKLNVVEKARKAEKGIWDEKAKLVQQEFKPILDLIALKKDTLARAIRSYDVKLEEIRREKQRVLNEAASKERAKLEAFAGKREEKLAMYQAKVEETKKQIARSSGDAILFNSLMNDLTYFNSKVEEFTEKVIETQSRAAQVVAPIVRMEEPIANKGTRKTMKATVSLVNMKDFAAWCVSHDECQFLLVDEARIKARIKEKEGNFAPIGLECSYFEETGFSGR